MLKLLRHCYYGWSCSDCTVHTTTGSNVERRTPHVEITNTHQDITAVVNLGMFRSPWRRWPTIRLN